MPFRLPFRPFAARLLVFFALGLSEVWAASVVSANAPFPALVERATLEKLPISGIEPLQEGATLRSGDFVVALLTSSEGPRRQQWLAEFRVVELTPQERAAPAPVATTVHTSTGRKFEFASHTAALRLRMFGPYAAEEQSSRTARAEEARVLVKTDFLAAGFDRNCAVALRIHEAKLALPYLLAGSPFPADRAARDAATAQANGITLEDERAMAVTGPALVEFLEIAQRTPGLKSLVGKIADLPPLLG